MAPIVVLITGANRGLGLGFVKGFISKPNYTVIAAVRDPSHPTSLELAKLPTAEGSSVIVVKYDAGVEQSPFDVAKTVIDHGINHLDYVVANAGIAKVYPFVKDVKRADIREHIELNLLSVISLYQATRDLLQKSTNKPTFAIMGSGAGSLSGQPNVPSAVYAPSKSILNWYGVRINAEDEWLNTFVFDPGWCQTEMGNAAAHNWGMESAPGNPEESTRGMVDVIINGTKEQYGGKFVLSTGEVRDW